MSTDAALYEDSFQITTILDQTYDRVARIIGITVDHETSLTLDINSELFPVQTGDNVSMLIATTLNLDGTKDERGWRDKSNEETLANLWDYVCYGKVYKHHDPGDGANMYELREDCWDEG